MDGPEMAELLKRIGWSSNELARRLGVGYRSLNGWLNGTRPIPENLAVWLREVAVALDNAPPLPDGWRRGVG
jgi:plasmid maintenance system antidote protein VapI